MWALVGEKFFFRFDWPIETSHFSARDKGSVVKTSILLNIYIYVYSCFSFEFILKSPKHTNAYFIEKKKNMCYVETKKVIENSIYSENAIETSDTTTLVVPFFDVLLARNLNIPGTHFEHTSYVA